VGFVSGSRQRTRAAGWTDFYAAAAARDAEQLREVAEKYPGTTPSVWAMQMAGDMHLMEASQELYRDRARAKKLSDQAVDAYATALDQTTETLIAQRATYGIGQAYEAMNDLSEAIKRYQEVTEKWPDSAIAQRAQQRIASLNRSDTREFYTWFFAQKPLSSPQVGSGTGLPGPFAVPREPDLSMPPATDLFGPEGQLPLDFPASGSADASDQTSGSAEGADESATDSKDSKDSTDSNEQTGEQPADGEAPLKVLAEPPADSDADSDVE
jgi:tetratricopeptide (TPR) repeat protein